MKEESSDEFQDLRKTLVERLENTWKDLDEDVLEIIDENFTSARQEKIFAYCTERKSAKCTFYVCTAYGYSGGAAGKR